MVAQEVRTGERREDAWDSFAFGSVTGRALDAIEVGTRPLERHGRTEVRDQEKEEGWPPHALIEPPIFVLSSI